LINVECFCKFEKKIYNQLVPLSFYMVSSTWEIQPISPKEKKWVNIYFYRNIVLTCFII
jgi:hypothetical protein